MSKETIKEERKRKYAQELLRYAGCLEDVDMDVADLCLKIMPKGEHLISLSDLNYGVQKIKNTLKKDRDEILRKYRSLQKRYDKLIHKPHKIGGKKNGSY